MRTTASKYPGWRTMTAAQRYNARKDRIFDEARRLEIERRNNLIALINTWNEATNPSVPRTDEEHAIERHRARIALGSIRRNYRKGIDYKELSNGALWPVS